MQGMTPQGEAREPALLDPASGFVVGPFGGPAISFSGPDGPRGMRPSRFLGNPPGSQAGLAQQLLEAQTQLSILQQHLSEPEPPEGAAGAVVFRGEGDEKAVVELLDPREFRQQQTEDAQRLSRQINDLRRQLFQPQGSAPLGQYEELLRPLARRLFLSPRFQEALEKRLEGKN